MIKGKKQFFAQVDRIANAMDKFPIQAAVTAVNFSKERFVMKNWVNRSREPWPKNSRATLKALRKRKGAKGSMMLRTGRLKRSIRKISWTRRFIVIGTDVPYAQINNDGGTINKTVKVKPHKRVITRGRAKGKTVDVKAHQRQMNTTIPQRKFLGESAILMRRIERLMERQLKEALKL